MTKKTPPIDYTKRDFQGIKQDLIEYAKIYYPETYKDFNEASFGSLLFDLVAYVGDTLSFYVDYQTNESFLDSAIETQNILKLAKQVGYKNPGAFSSTGVCAFYVTVPATTAGTPNNDILPILKQGTTLSSDAGGTFTLNEDVNFSAANTLVVVAGTDSSAVATSYAYKAYGEVVSGKLETEILTVNSYKKFLKFDLQASNVSEIISVIDSQGHEYFEVNYLSQNTIFKSIKNPESTDIDNAPYILRVQSAPRRFIVEHSGDGTTSIQFGYGSEEKLKDDEFPDPSTVVLAKHGKTYFKDDSFDPNLLLTTDKFGVVPPAGDLVVTYRTNDANNVNIPINSITSIGTPVLSFGKNKPPSGNIITTMENSLDVNNEEPISGQVSELTPTEIRTRAMDVYAAQNRAVTKQDYLSLVYQMPSKFGAIHRANIVQDKQSFKRNLNLYVVSEDTDGKLTQSSTTVKRNLKEWLVEYKMINDTVDILNGTIVNFGIEFTLIGDLNKDSNTILFAALEKLKENYKDQSFFGEPLYISDIYRLLNDIPGVLDAKDVKIVARAGSAYSSSTFNIENNVSADGRYVKVPENMILELRYPNVDIVGVVL